MEPLNWFFRRGASTYSIDINGLVFKSRDQQQMTPEQIRAMEIQQKIAELNMQAAIQQASNNVAKLKLIEAEIGRADKLSELREVEQISKVRSEAEAHLAKLKQAAEKFALEMRQDEEEHDQEMRQDAESFQAVKKANPPGGARPTRMVGYRSGERPYR